MRARSLVPALALIASPLAAQSVTFTCTVTGACRFEAGTVACSPAAEGADAAAIGGWEGSYGFTWDGSGFAITSPRGNYPGQLLTEIDAWPVVIASFDEKGAPPAVFSLYADGGLVAAIPYRDRAAVTSLLGHCAEPQ